MSIFLRGSVWWCDFIAPDGTRIKRSLGTKVEREAQELHDKLKAESWRVKELGEKQKRTLTEAFVRWLKEKGHKKSIGEDKRYVRFFLEKLPREITLDKITSGMISEIVSNLDENQKHPGKPVAPATKNRYLSFIRSVLNAAERHWEWIDKAPAIRLYKEPKRRIRWLEREDALRLIGELPEHWRPLVIFALSTGLRRSNASQLKWADVDIERRVAWVHPDEAKSGRAIGVALNQMAMDVIKGQIGKDEVHVFAVKGKPISVDSNTAWRNALRRAGIENFRFHDLRHTWASWLVQSGVGLTELQEMGGWESVEMVRRYAHLAPDHLLRHASKLDGMLTK